MHNVSSLHIFFPPTGFRPASGQLRVVTCCIRDMVILVDGWKSTKLQSLEMEAAQSSGIRLKTIVRLLQ